MRRLTPPGSLRRAETALVLALLLALGAGDSVARRSVPGWQSTSLRGAADGRSRPEADRCTRAQDPQRDGLDSTLGVMAQLREDHRRSIERTLAALDRRFDAWRERLPLFAEGLLEWGTRASLLWRSVRSWSGAPGAQRSEFVRERFETQVMSAGELRASIDEAIERFRLEMRADRARALARVRACVAWSMHEAPWIDQRVIEQRLAELEAELDRSLLRQADRSIAAGIAGVLGAMVATEAVIACISGSLGGAASGAAVAGAAGGSWAPGVGTVVGFAVGLGAGVAVDWWMHGRTRDEIVSRCDEALRSLRCEVLEGGTAGSRAGLRGLFVELAGQEVAALEQAIEAAIGGGP